MRCCLCQKHEPKKQKQLSNTGAKAYAVKCCRFVVLFHIFIFLQSIYNRQFSFTSRYLLCSSLKAPNAQQQQQLKTTKTMCFCFSLKYVS